jgi:hypothetical protein
MTLRFLFSAAMIFMSSGAFAQVHINSDQGGSISQYRARYEAIRASGERVVIDGMCFSACTLVLGIIPRDRVCATETALLGFHAAYRSFGGDLRIPAAAQTNGLMQTYPGNVRNWISGKGGLSSKMVFLEGRGLSKVVRRCRPGEV